MPDATHSTTYYGIPDLNYALDFREELELLRSTVKAALDLPEREGKSLVRMSAKRVVEACKLLKDVPRVVTEVEVFDAAAEYGVEREMREALAAEPVPTVDEIMEQMIASVPECKSPLLRDEVEAACDVVSREPPDPDEETLRRLERARRSPRRRYIVSERLRAMCRGGDSPSIVEEFGLMRRHAREVVILYDEALATGKTDIIVAAIMEVQASLVDAIAVGTAAARILGPMYDATLRLRLQRVNCRHAMPPGGPANIQWLDATIAIDALFGGEATRVRQQGTLITPENAPRRGKRRTARP